MQPQRDRFGRFLTGHSGGPGRPKRKHDPAYLNIIEEVISPDDWRAIIERVKHHALTGGGEVDILRFLAPYLLGRPTVAPSAENEDDNPNPLPTEPAAPLAQASLPHAPGIARAVGQREERAQGAYPERHAKARRPEKRT